MNVLLTDWVTSNDTFNRECSITSIYVLDEIVYILILILIVLIITISIIYFAY